MNCCDGNKNKNAKPASEIKGMLCYCFNHTQESIKQEWSTTGQTTVIADIKAKMKEPGCFCEESNPKGICCLKDVSDWMAENLK